MAGPALRRALLCGGVLLVLTGCSGTRFGDQLARSFSGPAKPAASPSPSPSPSPQTPAAPPLAPAPPAEPEQTRRAPRAIPANPTSAAAAPPGPAASSRPAPYRITIKLPAADPSAPAELVTRALRAAGVSFEVETIERVPSTPGPAAAAPATPTPTPAPAPR